MNTPTGNIDIDISRIEINNVNDNVSTKRVKKTENQVNAIASMIKTKLKGDQGSWEYYCKVAMNISESIINKNIEIAISKGNDPRKYFTWLCNRYMR